MDGEKVFKGLDEAWHSLDEWSINGTPFDIQIVLDQIYDALELLKEWGNEYENGFNDAMLGKQELMYEGTDGEWHKKDW